MQLIKDAHLTLPSEGRLTLQVPVISIGPETLASYPDEYFMFLKIVGFNQKVGARQRIAVGREPGFLYLSKKGFDHFKADLKQAFSYQRGHTWADFENYADNLFATVRVESRAHLKRLELEEQLKPTPYNKKRVQQMNDILANL